MPPPQSQYTEEQLAQFKREMDEAALLPLPDSSSSSSPGTKGKDTEEEYHEVEYVGELLRNEMTGHTIYDHGGPGPINPLAHPFPDNGNNVEEEEEEEEEEEKPLMEKYMRERAKVRGCQGSDGDEDFSSPTTNFNKPELESEEDQNEEEEEEEVQAYYTTPDGRLERATLAPGYAVRPAGISIEEYYKNEILGTGCRRAEDSDDDLDL
jgi:hypothetical protein